MRAIIPAAGFGTRLRPHTFSLPKVLLNVGGKPMLGHIIDTLLEEKISKATFVIGYLGEKIVEYVKKEYPSLNANFIFQEEVLGLGHAIYKAIPTFDDEEIFIILGDSIFDVDLKSVFAKKKSALGVKYVEDPSRFGVAICESEKIVKLVEKPKEPISNLALVGLYYINNKNLLIESLNHLVDSGIKTRGEFQFTDALQIMIDKGESFSTFEVEGWYDCGKPETLLSTNQFLLNKIGTNRRVETVLINDPVYISEKAIVGNCIVGPFTVISDGCEIYNSVIKNSIINSGSKIEKIVLEDSIIGSNSIIEGSYKKLNIGNSSEIKFY